MPTSVPNITSLKSNKSLIIKKALIIGAAATGLILAGAVTFAAVKPSVIADAIDAVS